MNTYETTNILIACLLILFFTLIYFEIKVEIPMTIKRVGVTGVSNVWGGVLPAVATNQMAVIPVAIQIWQVRVCARERVYNIKRIWTNLEAYN